LDRARADIKGNEGQSHKKAKGETGEGGSGLLSTDRPLLTHEREHRERRGWSEREGPPKKIGGGSIYRPGSQKTLQKQRKKHYRKVGGVSQGGRKRSFQHGRKAELRTEGETGATRSRPLREITGSWKGREGLFRTTGKRASYMERSERGSESGKLFKPIYLGRRRGRLRFSLGAKVNLTAGKNGKVNPISKLLFRGSERAGGDMYSENRKG